MSDLVAFLRARLDEDESRAKRMAQPGGYHWPWLEQRMLREVAAMRRILELNESMHLNDDWHAWWLDDAVKALAAVWSDHPDYDPAWAQ